MGPDRTRLTPSDDERELVLEHDLAISDIVFWELAKLIQLDRLRLDLSSDPFQRRRRHLTVFPISPEIARTSTCLDFSADLADEIIAATSVVHTVADQR